MPCVHVSIPKIKDVHVIRMYKTDLGTSPLYYGHSRRVNGGRRWSLECLFETCAGFYFLEMLEHKEQLIKNCIKYISMECS